MSSLTASDARAAACGDYDAVSPRRLRHYVRAGRWETPAGLWVLAQQINGGVFGGRGVAVQGDARALLAGSAADVAVLDAPYPGTARYDREYGVLDTLLGDPPTLGALTLDGLLEAARSAASTATYRRLGRDAGSLTAARVRRSDQAVPRRSVDGLEVLAAVGLQAGCPTR